MILAKIKTSNGSIVRAVLQNGPNLDLQNKVIINSVKYECNYMVINAYLLHIRMAIQLYTLLS